MAPEPAADADLHVRRHTVPPALPPASTGAPFILVVEDDADVREMLRLLLEGDGYQVLGAEDGAVALRYLHTTPRPDCILLDIWMPHMGGLAFRLVQQDTPDLAAIPVIAMSAYRRGPWLDTELQAAAYLEKPFTPEQLLALLAEVGCGPVTRR